MQVPAADYGHFAAEAEVLRAEMVLMVADAILAPQTGKRAVALSVLRSAGLPPPSLDERYGPKIAAEMRRDAEAAREAYCRKIKNTLARPGGRKLLDKMLNKVFFRGGPGGADALRAIVKRAEAELKAEGRLPEE